MLIYILCFLLLPLFYKLNKTSAIMLFQVLFGIGFLLSCTFSPDSGKSYLFAAKDFAMAQPFKAAIAFLAIAAPLKYLQQKLRYNRLNAIKMKYGYTDNPESWENMTIEEAQEVERNMAEWEFPRLWQFGWISDFLRTSTDPGVSRAIAHSGHFLHPEELIAHRRQQDTIHLMTAIAAYPVKSPFHSLAIARINEHHHRYGTKINSDDVLYLIIHFGFAPVSWINRFGYRQLEDFEVHAIWVLWREIGCRMGVKYIPKTAAQAEEWRNNFEKHCRWREQANEDMAMGLLNQIIYPIPSALHPFARKLVASIMDHDIVYFNQLEHLGPSPLLRSIVFDFFRLCGWFLREFGLPRSSAYKRSPDTPNKKTGLMNFGYTPYETTPFYIEPSFWNLYGPGALLRRLRGIPLPDAKYFGNGIAFESMGAPHKSLTTQEAVEGKVRANAVILEKASYGYRPSIGFQGCRLMAEVDGPSYGLPMNTFPIDTPTAPASRARFSKEYERLGQGYTKLEAIETPEDVMAFFDDEISHPLANGVVGEGETMKLKSSATTNGMMHCDSD